MWVTCKTGDSRRYRSVDLGSTSSDLYLVKNQVREMRSERSLSQAELGAALGVSRQTVSSIESGRYSPSLPLAFRLAHFSDTTVDEMFDASQEVRT
jgi:putative transcriptional regulator